GAAEAARKIDRGRLEAVLSPGRPVEVEQGQPGLVMVDAGALRRQDFQQSGLRARVVAVCKTDRGLFELLIVRELLHVDGKQFGGRKARARGTARLGRR